MSQEAQETMPKKLLREYEEASRQLEKIKSEAASIGRELEAAGKALQSNPVGVHPQGHAIGTQFSQTHPISAAIFDFKRIVTLTEKCRETSRKQARAHVRLIELGYPLH